MKSYKIITNKVHVMRGYKEKEKQQSGLGKIIIQGRTREFRDMVRKDEEMIGLIQILIIYIIGLIEFSVGA